MTHNGKDLLDKLKVVEKRRAAADDRDLLAVAGRRPGRHPLDGHGVGGEMFDSRPPAAR